jgi:cytochrome c biogenesis protein CcmG, thiol:disulfide interchange protein DsbE
VAAVEARGTRTAARVAKIGLQITAGALVVALLGLLAWRVATAQRGQELSKQVAAGRRPPAPGFDLGRLNGPGSLSLASLRGHVVVLNFWASWCGPCKHEAPLLQAAWRRYRARGVVVLGVDAQDFSGDARHFVRRYGLDYPSVHDGAGTIAARYGTSGFPETWFVDRRGRLVAEHVVGPLTAARLAADIARAEHE